MTTARRSYDRAVDEADEKRNDIAKTSAALREAMRTYQETRGTSGEASRDDRVVGGLAPVSPTFTGFSDEPENTASATPRDVCSGHGGYLDKENEAKKQAGKPYTCRHPNGYSYRVVAYALWVVAYALFDRILES